MFFHVFRLKMMSSIPASHPFSISSILQRTSYPTEELPTDLWSSPILGQLPEQLQPVRTTQLGVEKQPTTPGCSTSPSTASIPGCFTSPSTADQVLGAVQPLPAVTVAQPHHVPFCIPAPQMQLDMMGLFNQVRL